MTQTSLNQGAGYKGPLTGLNVIDFGHYYAGPMTAMMLADQGANVIHIVKPGEKEITEREYRLLNRNKKWLSLDLKTDDGKAQALALIAKADVLVENFRPGVMQRLGLDYASVKDNNPGLIYLSLPGFSSRDKERAQIQAWEGILGAASCCYTQLHLFRESLGYPPLYTRVPQCSTYGAVHGATAVMAALVARQRCGQGTVIEVPLVNSGAQAVALTFVGLGGDIGFPPPPPALAYSKDDSEEQQLDKLHQASQLLGLASKPYTCADGREIYISTYLTNAFVQRFLKALGLYEQMLSEGFVCEGPWTKGLDNDVGNTGPMSAERQERYKALITEKLLTKTSLEWEEYFAKFELPATVIRTRDEYLKLEPMHQAGILTKLGEGEKALTAPGRLGDVSAVDGSVIEGGYQEGEAITVDQAAAFFANGADKPNVEPGQQPLQKGDLLKGLKIVDFCNVIAGPTSSHTLAEYGAEVIKAEAPNGVHPMFIPLSMELNQGKRSLVADVKTAPGRDVFERLISWDDLVVHNVLDNTAQRMGVSQPQLQAINPDIVSCQLTGNGGTYRGVWENRPSFDNLVQGLNGLLAQYGTLEKPMWHGAISSADTIGGISMAFCSLLGVYQQRTQGVASEVRTSLIRATNHYQLPNMLAEGERTDWGEPKGQFVLGESWWQRMYACQDGWLYVGTQAANASALAQAVLGQAADMNDQLDAEMEIAMAEHDRNYWQDKFAAAGIACHKVLNTAELREGVPTHEVPNESANETSDGSAEILHWPNHPCGQLASKLSLESTVVGENHSWKRLAPAVGYGWSTPEILADLGYSADEIGELMRLRVVYEYMPGIGSKDQFFF